MQVVHPDKSVEINDNDNAVPSMTVEGKLASPVAGKLGNDLAQPLQLEGPLSEVERQLMEMNETHDRIREEFLKTHRTMHIQFNDFGNANGVR